MQLIARMLATVAGIILFSLCVFVVLASLQYNAILSNLTRERLVVLAETVRAPFQTVADLGVPIGTMRNADAVLERARASDEAIVAVYVLEPDGSVATSTTGRSALQIDPAVLERATASGTSANWHVETKDSFLVGANIAGATGIYAGAILVEYSKRDANTQTEAMEARLVLLAGAVFAVSVFLLLVVLRLVLSEHLRIFDGILASFDRFERRYWRGGAGTDDDIPDVAGLGVSTSEFRDLMEEAEERYQGLKRDTAHSNLGGPA